MLVTGNTGGMILNSMEDNSITRLIQIIKRLRAPDGCPWDREQTHKSVRGHLVEECAELLEAIDDEDSDGMREEIGDVLMHLLLNAEIESEKGHFDFYDVARELGDKLIRRHPHVFGELKVKDSDDVLKIWAQVKTEENKPRTVGGLFDGIPAQLSAMRYAYDIAKKATPEILEKTQNSTKNSEDKNIKFGRAMFDLILEATKEKIEPEGALRDYILEIKKSADNSKE